MGQRRKLQEFGLLCHQGVWARHFLPPGSFGMDPILALLLGLQLSSRIQCVCVKNGFHGWMRSNTKFQRCARPLKVVPQRLPKTSRLPSTTPTGDVLVTIFVAVRHVIFQCTMKLFKKFSSFFFSCLLG